MTVSALDRERMRQALALAHLAIGLSDPNPRVGCVLGDEGGRVFGEGHTQAAGSAHAEVMALRAAQAQGHQLLGATAWVTLEPCAHTGRTPPCCDALIAAGIARCVVALVDPYADVAGRGLDRMRAAGIAVELLDDVELANQARELNIGFFSRVVRKRPWVRVKMAASLDGRSALADGSSQWITGEAARADGHAWRKRAGAILTGVGTVLADDPRLDVRAVPTALQPLRVVLDSALRTPLDAALLRPPGAAVLVTRGTVDRQHAGAWRQLGVEVWDDGAPGEVPTLTALLYRLAARGVNELHVEAGPTLTGSVLAEGLADELLVYVAPLLIGPGLPMAALPALQRLDMAHRFKIHRAEPVGDDLRLLLRAVASHPDTSLHE